MDGVAIEYNEEGIAGMNGEGGGGGGGGCFTVDMRFDGEESIMNMC